jgi:site-specific recombinase XerD
LPEELGGKVPTPHKIERVPLTLPSESLIEKIRALPHETPLDERNRVLLWTLAESGCQVSEVALLRYDQCQGRQLRFEGKAAREIPVSSELCEAIQELKLRMKAKPGARDQEQWVFVGFNKFGSLGGAISSRGVELLVRHYATALAGKGGEKLTPRTFRHSAVLRWYREGCTREEIQRRLGLKTAYAFRSYEPLFKSLTPGSAPDLR